MHYQRKKLDFLKVKIDFHKGKIRFHQMKTGTRKRGVLFLAYLERLLYFCGKITPFFHITKMNSSTNITVIGSGNMGGALLRGWAKAARKHSATGECPLKLTATAHTTAKLDVLKAEYPEITVTTDNCQAISTADIIIIAVKPWLVGQVLCEIRPALLASDREPCIVSVAANIPSNDLQEMVEADVPCIYAMPNIAAEYGESMTFIEENIWTPSDVTEAVADLFRRVGEVRIVPSRLMAPGMMMAGCGIAYVMRYLRAMMEGGVEMGFYPADARQIALQTMKGAVTLLEETGQHPEVAIDRVTTPGGITIRGLNELDHAGFNSAVIRSLKAGL